MFYDSNYEQSINLYLRESKISHSDAMKSAFYKMIGQPNPGDEEYFVQTGQLE